MPSPRNKNWKWTPQTPPHKSRATRLITLALVPLGLLGLGYVACDKNPDDQGDVASGGDDFGGGAEQEFVTTRKLYAVAGTDEYPVVNVLGPDGLLYNPDRTYPDAKPEIAWTESPFFPVFLPTPVWSVHEWRYVPLNTVMSGGTTTGSGRGTLHTTHGYHSTHIIHFGSSYPTGVYRARTTTGSMFSGSASSFRSSSSSFSRSSSSSSSSHSSYSSHSTSRGGFGSTGHSMSSSSSS